MRDGIFQKGSHVIVSYPLFSKRVSMAVCRIYELNSAGHIASSRDFTCDSDEAEIAEATLG